MPQPIPRPDGLLSLKALRQMQTEHSVLGALQVFSDGLGPIFELRLPGFKAVMLVGPEAARFVLVSQKDDFRWRSEGDPVTLLLRHGVLVEDGESHDRLRRFMNPALHKQMLKTYVDEMVQRTDEVLASWGQNSQQDMLVEMRKVALLILMGGLYRVDYSPDMQRLWASVLKTIEYISPGIWMFWPGVPRPWYTRRLKELDDYLFQIIRLRRQEKTQGSDLLSLLVKQSDMDDDLIRDQLMTMLIAGHDTSTALLSWALYLLGKHPHVLEQAREEIDRVGGKDAPSMEMVSQLHYLDHVVDEALRMYPPIHLGSRKAAVDLEFHGYTIPSGTRVMYSIYLTHRLEQYWDRPHEFIPERFDQFKPTPYTYLPFGGGARNCIGAAFAQVEVKIVLARILQRYSLELLPNPVHAHMGATLEPRPGVMMRVVKRS
ncbi:MAG: cytochrome P450 [Anaerolineae bacterium]|nr:cytochrome P450 [Anaerolineae bacterium]